MKDKTAKTQKRKIVKLRVKKTFEEHMEGGVGGAHAHVLSASNPSMTPVDGSHQHLYMINGRAFMTDWDGAHQHSVDAANNVTGDEESPHKHRIVVDNDSMLSEVDGEHTHQLQVTSTTFDGIHRHELELLDGTKIQSLLPSDILTESVNKKKYNLEIQAVHVDTDRFPTYQEAAKWAGENDFDDKVYIKDPNDRIHTFRQLSRDRFLETSLTQMKIADGITATFGTLKENDQAGRGFTNDVEYMTFDMLQDKITRGDVLLTEGDREMMLRLKDEHKSTLSNLKGKLNAFGEAFQGMLDEIEVEEGEDNTLERYKSTYDQIASELNEVEIEGVHTDVPEDIGRDDLLKAVADIEGDVNDLYEVLEGSSLDHFTKMLGSFILTSDKVVKQKGYPQKPGSKKGSKNSKTKKVVAAVKRSNREWTRTIPILIKKNEGSEEERITFGIVLEPNDGGGRGVPLDPDAHRDIYSAKDVRGAAHSFMEDPDGGNQGFMHKFFMNEEFTLLENYVTKGKTEIETEDGTVKLRKGTWIMSVRVNSDSVWEMVKNKEITGFSIGGSAEVESLDEAYS